MSSTSVAMPSPLLKDSTMNEGGLCKLLSICHKNWLPWQRPLSDRKTKASLIILTKMSTNPENLVKISPAYSEIIVLC